MVFVICYLIPTIVETNKDCFSGKLFMRLKPAGRSLFGIRWINPTAMLHKKASVISVCLSAGNLQENNVSPVLRDNLALVKKVIYVFPAFPIFSVLCALL